MRWPVFGSRTERWVRAVGRHNQLMAEGMERGTMHPAVQRALNHHGTLAAQASDLAEALQDPRVVVERCRQLLISAWQAQGSSACPAAPLMTQIGEELGLTMTKTESGWRWVSGP